MHRAWRTGQKENRTDWRKARRKLHETPDTPKLKISKRLRLPRKIAEKGRPQTEQRKNYSKTNPQCSGTCCESGGYNAERMSFFKASRRRKNNQRAIQGQSRSYSWGTLKTSSKKKPKARTKKRHQSLKGIGGRGGKAYQEIRDSSLPKRHANKQKRAWERTTNPQQPPARYLDRRSVTRVRNSIAMAGLMIKKNGKLLEET